MGLRCCFCFGWGLTAEAVIAAELGLIQWDDVRRDWTREDRHVARGALLQVHVQKPVTIVELGIVLTIVVKTPATLLAEQRRARRHFRAVADEVPLVHAHEL